MHLMTIFFFFLQKQIFYIWTYTATQFIFLGFCVIVKHFDLAYTLPGLDSNSGFHHVNLHKLLLISPLGAWFPLLGTVSSNIFLIIRRHMLCELQTEPMWIDVSVKK